MSRRDRGSALVEFVVLGIGLLVPIAYLVLGAASVQSASYASAQAVREAARAFTTAVTASDAQRRALAAARLAFADQGLDLPRDALRLICRDGTCLAPGSSVEVVLSWEAPLPWLPPALGLAAPTIPIEAHQRVPVDDYRADP